MQFQLLIACQIHVTLLKPLAQLCRGSEKRSSGRIPNTVSQVAFNAEAAAIIKALVKAFPANGKAVGTALTGCGPDSMFLGY
jgi:hypothetical protein